METIRSILKQFYPLLIILASSSFVVYIFFSAEINDGKGVFEGVGNVYLPMIDTEEIKNDGFGYVGKNKEEDVPIIKYNAGVRTVGDCISFKRLFLVQKENGSFVEADIEDEFAIYLEDIKNQVGNSVLERLSSEEVENLEDIPAAFVYDREQDLLYLYGSGPFVVHVKVYGKSGAMQMYKFNLPVETL